MLSEEKVIEIERWDHNVSRIRRLKELNIEPDHFSIGKFLQLNSNG